MPTYIAVDVNSDLSPSWANTTLFDVDMDGSGTGTRNFSIPSSTSRSASYITLANIPNSDQWEDAGSQTVELDVNSGNMDIRGRCRIVRLSSTGTILESGIFTGFQTLTSGQFSFSPVAPTWSTSESCFNRIAIEWDIENTNTMMSISITFEFGTTDSEVITDITENAGSCTAPAGGESEYASIVG